MYQYPKRKKYKYIIPTIKGDCEIVFEQASASETDDYIEIMQKFLSKDDKVKIDGLIKQRLYLINFIKSKYKCKRYQFKRKAILGCVIRNIEHYELDIVNMLHRFRNSIYENSPELIVDGKKPKKYPFQSMFASISEETLIPVDQLSDRLTMEQLGRYSDKIIYDSYEKISEGKTINNIVMSRKGLSDEQKNDLELIKRFR